MQPYVSAIIAAAGSSRRMGVPKQTIELCGKPVLAHTLTAFENASSVGEIVVVARDEDVELVQQFAQQYGISKLKAVTVGGDTRQQSVANGVKACGDYPLIAIHDGARPLITADAINTVAQAARAHGGAAAAVPAVDTVKTADADGIITGTPDRRTLWQVQTPQIFARADYETALMSAIAHGGDYTDDCQLMEHMGARVQLVNVGTPNFKVTVPADVVLARAVLQERGFGTMRIGHGYDVHRLTEGRPLILGGVTIPYEKGLLGHSDADVLTHAVMDAILGAAALGDIGGLFPDTDPAYAGADSVQLLRSVIERVHDAGYAVSNLDVTVLAQAPKLKPHIPAMRDILAAACDVPVSAVNVKATTEEGLGFTGTGDGMAAHAVCLLTENK